MFEPRYVLFIQFFFVMTLSVIHFVSVLKEVEGTRFVLIDFECQENDISQELSIDIDCRITRFNPLIQNDQNVIFKCSLAII